MPEIPPFDTAGPAPPTGAPEFVAPVTPDPAESPPVIEAPPPPAPPPTDLELLVKTREKEIANIKQSAAPNKAVLISRANEQYNESIKSLANKALERLRAKEILTRDELYVLAEDLVLNNFDSQLALEKIQTLTGKDDLKTLLESRDLTTKDIPVENIELSKKYSPSWVKKAVGKSAISLVIGGLLSGGITAPIFLGGMAGITMSNFVVERWRHRAESKWRAGEVQGIVEDITNAKNAALSIRKLREQGETKESALFQESEKLIENLQKTSAKTLEAKAKLSDIKHQLKWAGIGIVGSVAGGLAGGEIANLAAGVLSPDRLQQEALRAYMELKKSGAQSTILKDHGLGTHKVQFFAKTWRWVIENANINPLHAVSASGAPVPAAVGLPHYESGHIGVQTITSIYERVWAALTQEAREKIWAQVVRIGASLGAGLLAGEAVGGIWHGVEKRKDNIEIKENAEAARVAWQPTAEEIKVRREIAQEKEQKSAPAATPPAPATAPPASATESTPTAARVETPTVEQKTTEEQNKEAAHLIIEKNRWGRLPDKGQIWRLRKVNNRALEGLGGNAEVIEVNWQRNRVVYKAPTQIGGETVDIEHNELIPDFLNNHMKLPGKQIIKPEPVQEISKPEDSEKKDSDKTEKKG